MTITVATPDVEADLLALLAAIPTLSSIVMTSGQHRNSFPGTERPSVNSGVPQQANFVRYVTTRYDHDNDELLRVFLMTVMVRGSKNADTDTKTRARLIHDGAASYGFNNKQFVGPASGLLYYDLRATGADEIGPDPSSDAFYWSVDLEMSYAG